MSWGEVAGLEPVGVIGGAAPLYVGVIEADPREAVGRPGQTLQRVKLLLPDGQRLDPPTRLIVRGVEVRVLGSKTPPWSGEPSIVVCERVNPDLPDELRVVRVAERALDPATAAYVEQIEEVWSGMGHVASGIPQTVDSAGEDSPLDRVTVTLPLSAPYASGLRIDVVASRAPGLTGRHFTASGEILESTAELRRFVAYRPGS